MKLPNRLNKDMKLYYLLLPLYTFIRQTQTRVGVIVVMIVQLLDLQLPVQLMPITTKVVSLNPAHAEVYLIQHQVIKFVSDLRQVSDFRRSPVSSTNKTDRHDTTEILLKVVLNTLNQAKVKSSIKVIIQIVMTEIMNGAGEASSCRYQRGNQKL